MKPNQIDDRLTVDMEQETDEPGHIQVGIQMFRGSQPSCLNALRSALITPTMNQPAAIDIRKLSGMQLYPKQQVGSPKADPAAVPSKTIASQRRKYYVPSRYKVYGNLD